MKRMNPYGNIEYAKKRRVYYPPGQPGIAIKAFRAPPGRAITVVPRVYGNPRTQTEHKFFDLQVDNVGLAAVTTTWGAGTLQDPTSGTLFAPIMGTNFDQRIGRKVEILSCRIKGFIDTQKLVNQTVPNNATNIRLIIVLDQQTNGVTVTPSDVILSGTGAPAIDMFQNAANFGRFKVLKDKIYKMQDPNLSWDGTNLEQNGLTIPFKFNYKWKKPLPIQFNAGNTGTVADIVNNSIHVLCGQNDTDLQCNISYKSRVVFIDK